MMDSELTDILYDLSDNYEADGKKLSPGVMRDAANRIQELNAAVVAANRTKGWHENNSEAPRETVLAEAERVINGQRQGAYGHPEQNFTRIADLWNAYFKGIGFIGVVTPQDTALMMILLKVARLEATPDHRDSLVDICGYAGTVEKLWELQ